MSGKDEGTRPSGWEVPPWELPGNFRLDCEAHRGPLLRWLANASYVLGLLSLASWLWGPFLICAAGPEVFFALMVPLGLLGAAPGLTAWLLARRDLAEMRAGRIDPSGEWETKFAHDRGRAGVLLNLFSPVLWVALLLVWVCAALS